MKFLTNSKFIITDDVLLNNERITQPLPNKKINSVIATLFKLNENMEYKSFEEVYLVELEKTINNILSVMDINFTLMIDISITSDELILKKVANIINNSPFKDRIYLLYYDSPQYRDKNRKNKMDSLIGTMVRFMFFFDYNNNPFNNVLITDVDYITKYVITYDILFKLLIKLKADYTFVPYDNMLFVERDRYRTTRTRIDGVINNDVPYACLATGQCIKCGIVKHSLFDKFVDDVMSADYKYEKYCVQKKYRLKHFCYGVDEYFLNSILVPYLYKNNKRIVVYDSFNYLASSGVYHPSINISILPYNIRYKVLTNLTDNFFNDYYNPIHIKIYESINYILNYVNDKYKLFKDNNGVIDFNYKNYNKYQNEIIELYNNRCISITDLLAILKYRNIINNKMFVIYQKGYYPDYNVIQCIRINNNEYETYNIGDVMINGKKHKLDKEFRDIIKECLDYYELTKDLNEDVRDYYKDKILFMAPQENFVKSYLVSLKKHIRPVCTAWWH